MYQAPPNAGTIVEGQGAKPGIGILISPYEILPGLVGVRAKNLSLSHNVATS